MVNRVCGALSHAPQGIFDPLTPSWRRDDLVFQNHLSVACTPSGRVAFQLYCFEGSQFHAVEKDNEERSEKGIKNKMV
jgi:hypothetical protein